MNSVSMVAVLLFVAAPPQGTEAARPFHDVLVEAVHHFAEHGQLAYLQTVLDKYPELRESRRDQQFGKPSTGDGFTPLQTAARHGRGNVVAFLIMKGAEVNVANGRGYTPLHMAAESGRLDIVKLLVGAGAEVSAKTTAFPASLLPNLGAYEPNRKSAPIPARTALQIAEDQKHTAVVGFLKTVK